MGTSWRGINFHSNINFSVNFGNFPSPVNWEGNTRDKINPYCPFNNLVFDYRGLYESESSSSYLTVSREVVQDLEYKVEVLRLDLYKSKEVWLKICLLFEMFLRMECTMIIMLFEMIYEMFHILNCGFE